MRWFKKSPVLISENTIRVKTKFLFWPRNFEDEIRWLEISNIVERYQQKWHGEGYYLGWVEIGYDKPSI